jgi:hypothetical protein
VNRMVLTHPRCNPNSLSSTCCRRIPEARNQTRSQTIENISFTTKELNEQRRIGDIDRTIREKYYALGEFISNLQEVLYMLIIDDFRRFPDLIFVSAVGGKA